MFKVKVLLQTTHYNINYLWYNIKINNITMNIGLKLYISIYSLWNIGVLAFLIFSPIAQY